MVRGWIIDNKIEDFLLQEAYARNTLCIKKDLAYSDDSDDESDDLGSVPEVDIVQETISKGMAAKAIYKELGVKFIPRQPLAWVAAHGAYTSTLSVYKNYDLNICLPKEDVGKDRVRFGFTSEPDWFPSALHCQCVE